MEQPLLMNINNTVYMQNDSLIIIDRRYLPGEIIEVLCQSYEDVARAIKDMAVQGAGDIAIAAAYGLYLAVKELNDNRTNARDYLLTAYHRLVDTRPTGYHLKALLDKILNNLEEDYNTWPIKIFNDIQQAIEKQQIRSKLTGQWAERVLDDGDTILTHCFPGSALLYMLKLAGENGKQIKVIASETRPYLQGAKLTAWSVSEMEIPVTLISDNMAAYCMNQELVTKVFTAADRIAADGTVANKVGTFQLALTAKYHKVPFYVLGYGGTDRRCNKAADIPIEMRDPEEVLFFAGIRTTGTKVKGFYPAFDITPPDLVDGIITDRGIFIPSHIEDYWFS